jgi:hypothetical protein
MFWPGCRSCAERPPPLTGIVKTPAANVVRAGLGLERSVVAKMPGGGSRPPGPAPGHAAAVGYGAGRSGETV